MHLSFRKDLMMNFFLLVVSLSASCRGQDNGNGMLSGNGMQSGHGMQIGDGIIPEVWVVDATEQFTAAVQHAQETLVGTVVGTVQQTLSTNQVSDSSKFF
jgi:hypothetical protein